jgi:hypothetical protein
MSVSEFVVKSTPLIKAVSNIVQSYVSNHNMSKYSKGIIKHWCQWFSEEPDESYINARAFSINTAKLAIYDSEPPDWMFVNVSLSEEQKTLFKATSFNLSWIWFQEQLNESVMNSLVRMHWFQCINKDHPASSFDYSRTNRRRAEMSSDDTQQQRQRRSLPHSAKRRALMGPLAYQLVDTGHFGHLTAVAENLSAISAAMDQDSDDEKMAQQDDSEV